MAHFSVTVNIFRGPKSIQNATFQSEILELESYKNIAQHDMCPIFLLLKNHSTLVNMLYFLLKGQSQANFVFPKLNDLTQNPFSSYLFS